MACYQRLASCLFTTLLFLPVTADAADMPGSADHPLIPRVSGAEIYGYAKSGYDVTDFVSAAEKNKLDTETPEGEHTRLLYIAKPGDSPLMVQKNYETALGELGEVEEVFRCRDKECSKHAFVTLLWNKDSMPETHGLKQPFYLMAFAHNVTNPSYRYARVVKDSVQYHVGVFTAGIADNNPNVEQRGSTAVLVDIIEVKDFEPTLEFVDATEMKSQIDAVGHVALYGIHFDHDKATLRAESSTTIDEIVKVLKAEGALKIYVVGHTDGVGALEYNQALSLRRAQTVVDALTNGGVESARLTPIGIGPVAPIASNDSEQGRELNRRVELVKRP